MCIASCIAHHIMCKLIASSFALLMCIASSIAHHLPNFTSQSCRLKLPFSAKQYHTTAEYTLNIYSNTQKTISTITNIITKSVHFGKCYLCIVVLVIFLAAYDLIIICFYLAQLE